MKLYTKIKDYFAIRKEKQFQADVHTLLNRYAAPSLYDRMKTLVQKGKNLYFTIHASYLKFKKKRAEKEADILEQKIADEHFKIKKPQEMSLTERIQNLKNGTPAEQRLYERLNEMRQYVPEYQ